MTRETVMPCRSRLASATARGHHPIPIPIPPGLIHLLDDHLRAFGTAAGGRLFAGARGGILSESAYGRARHAALTLWLGAGVAPEEAAARAGNSLTVLHVVYAHPVPGQDANTLIDRALHPQQTARHYRMPAPSARGPRLAPETAAWAARTRPRHSGTQLDPQDPAHHPATDDMAPDLRR